MKITMDYEEYLELKKCYATIQCKEKFDEIKRLYAKNKEEKKIPDKLIKLNNVSNASDLIALSQMQWENNNLIEVKLNQVIDYLKSKGE